MFASSFAKIMNVVGAVLMCAAMMSIALLCPFLFIHLSQDNGRQGAQKLHATRRPMITTRHCLTYSRVKAKCFGRTFLPFPLNLDC